MKKRGRPQMRFFRHGGIYRSDVSSLLFTPGACPAFRSGRCQGIRRAGKSAPFPSSAMSSGRLFLDRVGRHQSPSPLRRQRHHKTLNELAETKYHRTASSGLTGCLTLGVHPISHPKRVWRKAFSDLGRPCVDQFRPLRYRCEGRGQPKKQPDAPDDAGTTQR